MADRSVGSTRRLDKLGGARSLVELQALALTIHEGPDAGRRVILDHPVIRVGQGPDNDLVLSDETVSHTHLTLTRRADGILLQDRGSTNGTFVNGIRVHEAILPPGARFVSGATTIQVDPWIRELEAGAPVSDHLEGLVGRAHAMQEVYGLLSAVADSSISVLILGETGTGKEVTARTVHTLSGRTGPFVVFNCASSSAELIRSELFGHEAGAFTGAEKSRQGAFRRAHGGTLFLDEIGELPLELQPNLLRVLETREVQPLGLDEPVPVDVRLVAATHRDLEKRVLAGTFREDLLHRINVISVTLPSLRDRREDLPLLVDHLVRAMKLDCVFGPSALEALGAHSWPGNVRELRNVVERCGALCRGREVTPADLRLGSAPVRTPPASAGVSPGRTLADVEKETVLGTLTAAGGRRREAARRLGISITTLRRKLKDYGIGPADGEDETDDE